VVQNMKKNLGENAPGWPPYYLHVQLVSMCIQTRYDSCLGRHFLAFAKGQHNQLVIDQPSSKRELVWNKAGES
jgi:hypothetical protein